MNSISPFDSVLTIAAGSSQDYTKLYLDRIATSSLNAVVVTRPREDVMADAAASDYRKANGIPLSLLDGVPFTLKVCHQTAGVRTSNGTSGVDYIPTRDGDIAAKLKAAGCILLGKTNIANNPVVGTCTLFGETCNPQSLSFATGGSSCGAAAAVSAGLTGFDIGVDAAGSIRIPSSFCGIYGLKTTNRAISSAGDNSAGYESMPPFDTQDVYSYGPIVRSLDDILPLTEILAGPTPSYPDIPTLCKSKESPIKKLIYLEQIGTGSTVWYCSPFIVSAIEILIHRLEADGVEVVRVDFPWFNEVAFTNIYNGLVYGTSPLKQRFRYAPSIPDFPWYPQLLDYTQMNAGMPQARVHQIWLRNLLNRLLDDADAIICGTTPLSPPPFGTPLIQSPPGIAYMAFTALFNLTGNPAITLPMTSDPSTKVPSGLQVIGRHWKDFDLLSTARQINSYLPGYRPTTV